MSSDGGGVWVKCEAVLGFHLFTVHSLNLHISTAIPVTDYFSKAKMRFQSFFMLMTIQPSFFASSLSASVKMPTFVSGRPWGDHRHTRVSRHRVEPTSQAAHRRRPWYIPT